MVHHTNWYGHSSLSNHVPEHGAIIGAPLCIKPATACHWVFFLSRPAYLISQNSWSVNFQVGLTTSENISTHTGAYIEILAVFHQKLSLEILAVFHQILSFIYHKEW